MQIKDRTMIRASAIWEPRRTLTRGGMSPAFGVLLPLHAEQKDTGQAHNARQDRAANGSGAHASLQEEHQCDRSADNLSLSENEAKNRAPSDPNRRAFAVAIHNRTDLSKSGKPKQ